MTDAMTQIMRAVAPGGAGPAGHVYRFDGPPVS
jgi:hypothetical protein